MRSINTIVVPQGAEYQAVCRGLQKARVNNADNLNHLEIIAIPIGIKFAEQFLSDYVGDNSNSKGILIMGLCGSLADSYSVGDSVLVKSCQDLNHDLVHLDEKLTAEIQRKLSLQTVAGLTSDRLITQAQSKSALARQYGASIVEMEGYGYVNKLQQHGLAVAMLRVVSDDSHSNLPDLERAIDSQGNLQTVSMTIAFAKQPMAAIRLIKSSLAGLKALKQITTDLFTV